MSCNMSQHTVNAIAALNIILYIYIKFFFNTAYVILTFRLDIFDHVQELIICLNN